MQVKGANKSSSTLRTQKRNGQTEAAPAERTAAHKISLEEFTTPSAGKQSGAPIKKAAPKAGTGRETLSEEMIQTPRRVVHGGMQTNRRPVQTGGRKSASSKRASQALPPRGEKGSGAAGRAARMVSGSSLDMTSTQLANQPHRAETAKRRKKAANIHPGRLFLLLFVILGLAVSLLVVLKAMGGKANEEGPLAVGNTAKIATGVTILGIDVSGQTKSAARDTVSEAVDAILADAQITLLLGDEHYVIKGTDLSLACDMEAVLQQALTYEPPAEDEPDVVDVTSANAPGTFNDIFTYDQAALRRIVEDIAAKFDIEPVSAIGEPTMNEDHTVTFAYQEGKTGRALDVDATVEKIEAMFSRGIYAAQIDGVYSSVEPAVTADMLSGEIGLRGSYTTRYPTIGQTSEDTPVVENRVFNIHKAADIINGCMVAPGEEWSFNSYVGPRTVAGGWKEAKGIAYGKEYTMQAGGGICQVSTTLYNALQQSKVTITERQAHSIPSDYVKHGLDATVDYATNLDLKFKNDTGAPLYLFVYYEDVEGRHRQDITFVIYGKPLEHGVSYKMRSEIIDKKERTDVIYTDDETIPRGYKVVTIDARPSYKAEVYLDKYVGEGMMESEYLYTDNYAGNAQYAKRGTGSPKYHAVPEGAVPIE